MPMQSKACRKMMSAWLPLSTNTLCKSHPATLQLITMASVWRAAQINVPSIESERDMGPFCLYHWAGEIGVVDTAVVVLFRSLGVEVDAGSPSDHVNDPAVRFLGKVFFLGC
jgi:hypothetical protein